MASPCIITFEGKKYSFEEYASMLHDGLLDQMVQDGIVDDSRFTPMLKTVEKTDDQIAREQTRETEILLNGLAEKRRAEGKFVRDGVEYVRNPKNQGVVSNLSGKVRFTNDISVPFKYKLVEEETLQPSHQNGIRNPLHFIPEAQPKNRNDEGSIQAEESFANKPRFNELGESTNAYSGAPIVNDRNEVVQGNNRSAGLKKGYDRNNQQYKNDLIDNAKEFGFSEEQVRSMKNPILVRQIASNDQGAIELGNYDVKDLETGGTRRLDPVAITRRMPFGVKGALAELMFSGEDTLNQAIRNNQKRIIDIISPYLNQAQRSTISKDGALTDIGVKDIEDIAKQFLFDNGDSSLPDLFDNLSATQKEGLRRSLPYIFSVSPEKSLVQDIQVAIIATNDFLSSGAGGFDSWLGQGDMFNDGMTPKEKYTPLEIAISRLLVDEKTQKGISNVFLDYAKQVKDKAADMFEPEKKGKSRKEGVLEIFKVEDNEKPNSTGGGEAVGAEQEIEGQETERKGINIRATPSVQKKESEIKIKALSEIEAFKAKVKEAKEKLNKLNRNLGIAADSEQKARALFEYHKALVGLAKAYLKEGVNSIKDFANEIGESVNKEVRDAWNEANGKIKKKLSDFIPIAEKEQKEIEKENLRKEDLGLVTPRLEDYASEEPVSTSKDFESLAFQPITSDEFRDTLSNKERESGKTLTRAEKRYQVNPLMAAFELGENIVAKAKEEFGDTYVNDLLSYVEKNQNTLGVDKVSLILLSLENDLNRQQLIDPENLTLAKQEKMVQNIAIAYQRSAARAVGYGRLRRIARVGYDVDEVTSQLFSSEQVERRRKVEKAMESTADDINDEAELQEQETEGELVIEEPKVKRSAKQVKADIRAVIEQMKADLVKSARGAGGALSKLPFQDQVEAITPHVIKLSKLFAELGGMKAKEIVAEIRKSIKDISPDVDEAAITDILKEGKRVLTEEQKRKNYIKSLERDIDDLDVQIEQKTRKVVSREDKYKNDEEIQNLRDIKNGKKDLLNTLDPSYAERVKLKNDLNAAQRSLEEYERKIAENDFGTARKPVQQDIDSKLKDLRDKRDSAKNEYQQQKKAFEASLITPESIEEKNIDRAIKATEKSIAELERKLAEGDVLPAIKGQSPYSKQLGELKQKQSDLRDKLIEERNKAVGKAAPKDRLEQAKDRVKARIEELKQEIADKRKELKIVNKVKSDAELDALLEQEKALKDIARQYLTQESIDRINESKEKAIVTKLENEIANLDEQITNQQKIQKAKPTPVTSLEITLLRAQRKAKMDVLNDLDPNPKAFTQQALIDAGYGREITVTTKQGKEQRQVLDWKKLAGKEMDVTAIQNIVEQALANKGFTPTQISRMQYAFAQEFTNLRASVIDKSLKALQQMNEPKKASERKSAAKKLAELFDFGLFDQNPDKFNYLLNKIIGLSDFDQESFFELNKLSESLKEINSINSNEFFTKQFIRQIQSQITQVLNRVARQQGSTSFKVVSVVAELHNLGTRTLLLSLKQFLDNQISGRQERLIQNIGLMGERKMDTKELKKLRSEYASVIKDDITKNAGLYFGEVNSPFLTKTQIDDYINSMSDSQIWHSLTSIAFGKSYLEAADSMNKAASTERFFTSMLLKVLTDDSNPNKMTPEEALKFVNEQLTGQKFEDAVKESARIINQINTSAGKTVIQPTKGNIIRGAMDLVKANLLVGQALDANSLESAYNAAYTAAGYGLGHEANNPLSLMINQFQAGLEEKTKAAIKEKEWGRAAALTFGSSIYRNIVNPFVGGGTNWLFLGLQKSGIEPLTPLYYWWEKSKGGIDMSTETGRKTLENKLVEDYRLKTLNRRLLIGGIASTLVTLSLFASGGDDELEEWFKKNKWADKYKSVFIPQLTLLAMSVKNDTFGKWIKDTFAKSDKFEQLPKIIKAYQEYNKGDEGEASNAKFMGTVGNILGSYFNTPLIPVPLLRDLGGVYRWIVDEPQKKPDFKNVGFANGFFNYGLIDYLGFRPDRSYMKDMEEYIPKSDVKTIKFLREKDLELTANSDKSVLVNGLKKSLSEDEAQKYDNVWGKEAYRIIKEALDSNEDITEAQLKSLKKTAEFIATEKAQSELGVEDASLQQLEIDGVKYTLNEGQIRKRKSFIREYIKENRQDDKFKERYREAVKSGKILNMPESKRRMLMESAESSATRKIKELLENKTSLLEVAPK